MIKNNILAFLLIGSLIALPTKSQAQWVETNGQYEAAVYSLAASDSFIFTGTVGAGIYRSTDNGVTWTPSNGGMASTFTHCFAVNGNNAYAGSLPVRESAFPRIMAQHGLQSITGYHQILGRVGQQRV